MPALGDIELNMGLTICLEDENGELIAELDQEFDLLDSDKINDKEFKLIWGIDPYGDSVFNRVQMRSLIGDFEKLKSIDLKNIKKINEIIDLAKKCEQEVHAYLKFYGD